MGPDPRNDLGNKTDVQEFLDAGIIEVLTDLDVQNSIDAVRWTVIALQRALGDDALIPPEERIEGIAARFSLRALEGIAVGIMRNKAAIEAMQNRDNFVRERVSDFWLQPAVAEMSAAGLRGTVRIQRSVPFGATWFRPNA